MLKILSKWYEVLIIQRIIVFITRSWYKIKTSKIVGVFLIVILFSFAVGVVIGDFKYSPYGVIRDVYKEIIPQKTELDEPIDSHYREVNASSLIHIQNEMDLLNKREALIHYIWKENSFPYDKMPTKIEQNIQDDQFSDLWEAFFQPGQPYRRSNLVLRCSQHPGVGSTQSGT